jgi:hypothetical protein
VKARTSFCGSSALYPSLRHTFANVSLIVSVAAVFEREAGIFTQISSIDRSLTIRRTPLSYPYQYPDKAQNIREFFQDTMRTVTSNWIYSALKQLTLEAEEPAWTQQGWGFSAVDLDLLPRTSLNEVPEERQSITQTPISTVNLTLTASAIRARLQCNTVSTKNSSWFESDKIENDLFKDANSTVIRNFREELRQAGDIFTKESIREHIVPNYDSLKAFYHYMLFERDG